MENYFRKIARLGAGFIALTVAVAFAATAHAAPQYNYDCRGCHDMPPMDSKAPAANKKDPKTGAVPGNHETHATGDVKTCLPCHDGALGLNNAHRNKSIELTNGMGYNLGFVNQTSVPRLNGSCGTVRCHSNGRNVYRATPAWGSAKYSTEADCTSCHDVAPSTGNHNTPGSKHGIYYGTGASSCSVCHSNHLGEAKPFAHATSSRSIQVRFATSGSWNGTQCSALYCHSNGQGTAIPVTWNTSLPADCSGCHGNTAGAGSLTGKHAKHVNNIKLQNGYGCADCHLNVVDGNTHVSNTAKHVNSMLNYSGVNAGRLSGTCSNLYCHSDGRGTFKVLAADAWRNGSFTDCRGCHGSDGTPEFTASSAGEPNYFSSGQKPNSHKQHVGVAGATTCVYCHSTTTTNGSSIIGNAHTNRVLDVAPSVDKPFGVNGRTCSDISCHKGGTIIASVPDATWGATLSCAGCHGDAATLNTYAHQKHLTTGSRCDSCHDTTAVDNQTLKQNAPHLDYGVQVTGAAISSIDTNKNCTTTCHMSYTPKWTDPSTGACGTCHAALSNDPGPLKLITSVAHSAHFTATYGPKLSTTAIASCDQCHTPYAALSHANGTTELKAGASKNGVCLDCHKQTTVWNTSKVTCQSCHSTAGGPLSVIGGIVAADKTLDATKGHGAYAVACSSCHDPNGEHISGALGDNNRILGGLVGDAQCNSCHKDSGKVQARSLNMQVHDGMANSCGACHDAHGTKNSFMVYTGMNGVKTNFSGGDYVNPNGTGICQACHNTTGYYKKGSGLATNHPQSGCVSASCHPHNTSGGIAFQPSGACDSCHGYPPMPRNVAVTFGIQGNWTSAKFEDYSGGGGAHAVAAHVAKDARPSDGWSKCTMCHTSGAHDRSLPIKSHIENVTVTLDQQYRLSADTYAVYTGAQLVSGANKTGTCFNVSCHFRQTDPWSTEK